jgi:hypothetical protein
MIRRALREQAPRRRGRSHRSGWPIVVPRGQAPVETTEEAIPSSTMAPPGALPQPARQMPGPTTRVPCRLGGRREAWTPPSSTWKRPEPPGTAYWSRAPLRQSAPARAVGGAVSRPAPAAHGSDATGFGSEGTGLVADAASRMACFAAIRSSSAAAGLWPAAPAMRRRTRGSACRTIDSSIFLH